MASSLQKLLKKPPPPPTTILTALKTPQSPNLTKTLIFNQPHIIIEPKQDHNNLIPKNDNLTNLTQFKSSLFYPNFPFGFSLNPICSTGSIQSESNDDPSGDAGIWADSVKKKRKKKMNKHKYKKLRKRLRRKT